MPGTWRLDPGGSCPAKLALAEHGDIEDSDLGSSTVKLHESEKEATDDGSWRHTRITLKPDSTDATYQPIILEDLQEGELRIIAELVRVLGYATDGAHGR